jgi:hypothetical protein
MKELAIDQLIPALHFRRLNLQDYRFFMAPINQLLFQFFYFINGNFGLVDFCRNQLVNKPAF